MLSVSSNPQILHFLFPLPVSVQVGAVPSNCSQSCPLRSFATGRVSLCVAS